MGLAEIAELHSYEKGTVISREGEVSDHLFIVKSGSLAIVKTREGIEKTISVIGQGET
jgi:CRP-like cAMP-binding protein